MRRSLLTLRWSWLLDRLLVIRRRIITIEISFRPHTGVKGVPIEGVEARVVKSCDALDCSEVVVEEKVKLGTDAMGAKVEG